MEVGIKKIRLSHRIFLALLFLIVTCLLIWSLRVSQAANRTWTGASISNPIPSLRNNFWTTPENWAGNVAPVVGDDLIFGSSAQPSSLNTFANGTTFNSISISPGNVMQGSSVALNSGISATGGQISLSAIKLNNDQTFNSTTAGTGPLITSPIDTNGMTLILGGAGSLTSAGVISGSGSLLKDGSGITLLAGNNSYTGNTTAAGGTLLVFGSQPSSAVKLLGGTLGGTGTVGPVQALGARDGVVGGI